MIKVCRFCQGKTRLLYSSNGEPREVEASAFFCTNRGYGNHKPIIKCDSCGIIYVDEEISQKEVSSYYQVVDDTLYFKEQGARKKTFDLYLKSINIKKKGKLLDIGTNTGLFVKMAQDDGWDAVGLEPSRSAVIFAKKNYGIDVINKSFDTGLFKPNSFDVITMWDVIEHFTDPISEIKKVQFFLKKGGMFAFSTVDPESLWAKIMGKRWSWYMEMHKVFFSREVAKKYLLENGFEKVIFTPHWRYISLGYVASRFGIKLDTSNVLIPFYANDLYNCYAFKKAN